MNLKKLGFAVVAASMFTFMACDDSSSASSETPAGGEDQPSLSSESNNAGGDEAPASSSSVESSTKESTDPAKEGSKGKTDEPPAASSASEEPANEEPNTDAPVDTSANVGPGSFDFDTTGFTFDSTAFADMMKCDEEGATQNMMGAAVLVCTDGQWVYDSTATAAANKCDEEGATKTESMGMGDSFSMDMTYICKDGQWEMQMPDFGGMFGGDSTGGFPGGMGNWGDSSFTMPGGGQGGFPGGNFGGSEIPEETPGLK